MPQDMEKAIMLLAQGDNTCVLCRGEHILTTGRRGIAPLLAWLDEEADTWACCAADKVVGKGAALLYCLLGVRCVHGHVMSLAAVKVLRRAGIEAYWDILAEAIGDRAGTGLCPVEAATATVDDAEAALPIIRLTLEQLQRRE